jgi:nicotinamide mononucleotide transporter
MRWFKESFKGFTNFEKIWLTLFSVVIVLATCWFSVTGTDYSNIWSVLLNWVVSPLSALTGVICVVLCAKGNIQNFWWGIINAVSYGLVAWVSGYYGDWMLNWVFFIPAQIFIFLMWRKNIDSNGIVKMKRLKPWTTTALVVISLVAVYFFATFLMGVDNFFTQAMKRSSAFYGNMTNITGMPMLGPLMDSATVILQIVAEVLLILMFAEQWLLWIAVDIITIAIWGTVVATDPTSYAYSVPTLIMWIAFLVNALYGTFVWYRKKA